MLALIESEKRSGVCRTMPIWRRSEIEIHRADVHAVHEHRAFRHIVEARDQVDQRGLAGAGLADQGDDLVRLDGQVDVGQGRGFFVLIAKRYVAEFDAAAERRECHRICRGVDLRFVVQDFEDALRPGGRFARAVDEPGQLLDRARRA